MAEFAHNQWPNATTKKPPFNLIMGYVPSMEQIKKPSPVPQVEERLVELERIRKVALEAMLKVQAMLQVKNPEGRRFRPYKEGEHMWIEGTNLKTMYPSAKLGPKWYGPFKVLKQFSNAVYRVEIPWRWKIHNVFHANLLTPYKETELHGPNFTQPPPDLIEGEEEFEVEKILDAQQRGRGRKLHFLVKWKGYPVSDNSWEKAEDVHTADLVKEFYTRKRPNKTKVKN
jgi:hypothetical protein